MRDCSGQSLTSLPSTLPSTTADLQTATTSLLSSLTSLRTHFLFMRLDYHMSPGLPCQPVDRVELLTRNYKRSAANTATVCRGLKKRVHTSRIFPVSGSTVQ